jgi:hypothetical protein
MIFTVELQPPFPCMAGGGKVSLILARPEGLHTLLQLWTSFGPGKIKMTMVEDGNAPASWPRANKVHMRHSLP